MHKAWSCHFSLMSDSRSGAGAEAKNICSAKGFNLSKRTKVLVRGLWFLLLVGELVDEYFAANMSCCREEDSCGNCNCQNDAGLLSGLLEVCDFLVDEFFVFFLEVVGHGG